MNPFLQAIMRIAQGHYGGNTMGDPRAQNWLRRISQSQEARHPVTQNVIAQLGLRPPGEVMRMPRR